MSQLDEIAATAEDLGKLRTINQVIEITDPYYEKAYNSYFDSAKDKEVYEMLCEIRQKVREL